MKDGEYHVAIEPRAEGGYIVSLTGPRITLADAHVVETVREAREWAERRVAWHRTKDEPMEYQL